MPYAAIYIIILLKGLLVGLIYSSTSMSGSLYVLDTLQKHGEKKSFIAGFGLALTHLLWAALAVFVLKLVFRNIEEHRTTYTFIGSLLLIYFAIKTMRKKRKTHFFLRIPVKSYKIFLESLSLGLSSPMKIIGYAIFYASLGISQTDPDLFRKAPLLLGTFLGALLFWVAFTIKMKSSLASVKSTTLKNTNKIAAIFMLVLAGFGLTMGFVGLYKNNTYTPKVLEELKR